MVTGDCVAGNHQLSIKIEIETDHVALSRHVSDGLNGAYYADCKTVGNSEIQDSGNGKLKITAFI